MKLTTVSNKGSHIEELVLTDEIGYIHYRSDESAIAQDRVINHGLRRENERHL